jgi:hypothetical protein
MSSTRLKFSGPLLVPFRLMGRVMWRVLRLVAGR